MFTTKTRSLVPLVGLLVAGLVLAGCDQSPSAPEQETAKEESILNQYQSNLYSNGPFTLMELIEVVRATARYQFARRAQAAGYVLFSPFVPNMGYHYLHNSAIGEDATSTLDRSLSRANPEILVYVPRGPIRQLSLRGLVAVEYAIPKQEANPPPEAVNLFSGADAHDWHVHPSSHELPLSNDWTVHGECHYRGGLGVFLVESPSGAYLLWTPPTGPFGSWNGSIAPDQCPTSLGGDPLPPLLIVHGKWWTLHAWVWLHNPEGVFHPTNPNVQGP